MCALSPLVAVGVLLAIGNVSEGIVETATGLGALGGAVKGEKDWGWWVADFVQLGQTLLDSRMERNILFWTEGKTNMQMGDWRVST
jgi:hypothetical protein